MANEEHLKILKQGVEQWNKWRFENAILPSKVSEKLTVLLLARKDLGMR